MSIADLEPAQTQEPGSRHDRPSTILARRLDPRPPLLVLRGSLAARGPAILGGPVGEGEGPDVAQELSKGGHGGSLALGFVPAPDPLYSCGSALGGGGRAGRKQPPAKRG